MMIIRIRNLVVSLLLIFSGFIAEAETYIKGRVTDLNGSPLAGASVCLPNRNRGTLCDKDGYYLIKRIVPGKVLVQFSYMGYDTRLEKFIAREGTNVLNVSLKETSIEMHEIVVSGGLLSSQRNNAVKIDVLRSDDIQLAGTPNLMEALTEIPGVDMISRGPGLSKPVIRGLSMNGILIAKDGTRIENYQYSEGHPAGVDDNGAERIEIIKGPASLLYGSDAIGGVINFVGGEPCPQGKVEGSYRARMYSNTLGFANDLNLRGSSDKFFAGVSLDYKTHADYKQGGGDYVPNSRFNEWSADMSAGFNTKIGTFSLSYYYYKQQVGMTVPAAVSLISKRGRDHDIWYQNPHHNLISLHNKLFLGRLRLDVDAAWQSNIRSAYNTTDVPFVEMRLNTFTYGAKLHLPSDKNSDYIIGVQGMEQKHKNLNDRIQQGLQNADISRLGIMAYASHTFFMKLKLQGGLRLDLGSIKSRDVSDHFTTPNGSFGATYSLTDKVTFRANLAKASRTPNLRELLFTGLSGNRYEIAGENLKSEEAYESDISFHYSSKNLSVDAALFYNSINNYIFLSPTDRKTDDGVNIYMTSQNNARLYGGEAGIHYHPSFISWFHIKASYSSVIGKQKDGSYLPFIPAHKLRYEIGLEKNSLWLFEKPSFYISALSAFAQKHPSRFETRTCGYTIFNVKADAAIKIAKTRMVIGLSANNILDKKYIDHLSTLKTLNYYDPGRNICLSVKITVK
ncbi:MAG: TonB-dependent receptor [Bacteroidales bacterium]|jgi:iron complex outermembrane receptor protein|nr:TonB-dependent receptor [Bacteroidales bacterium]